jgi:6-phosphogluconolactonase (cycloisomerase 2 family)
MKRIWKVAGSLAAGLIVAGMAAPSASAAAPAHGSYSGGSSHNLLFVQNDDPDGNTVFAYRRTAAGGLTQVGTYPTGGNGGVLSGSVVDHLASQGALTYQSSARLLYAVNAGSNTLSTFRVAGDRLVRRQVLGTGGQFPVSVAAHGNQVYVLNARDGGSISGYLQVAGILVPIPSWHRDLHLNTSAPGQADEFVSTPGQIGFTPDGRELLVSTKNGGNSVEAFRVGPFGPAWAPEVTSLPGTVPFGFTFDRREHLVLTEAGTNSVATFRVSRTGVLVALDSAGTGQAATCWIAGSGGTFYVSNAGSGTVSRYTVSRSGALAGGDTTATDAGTVDAAASSDGRYLYVQAGAAGIVDAYRINSDGSLTATGSVTVPDATGAEGIVAL